MAETDWKPGDVAMAECLGMRVVGIVDTDLRFYTTDPRVNGISSSAFCLDSFRPLLVIDPEDREQVERLHDLVLKHGQPGVDRNELDYRSTTEALRAMLAPLKPPKPEEPLGLGAVVADSDERIWVRDAAFRDRWFNSKDGKRADYADINAVEVLNAGWDGVR